MYFSKKSLKKLSDLIIVFSIGARVLSCVPVPPDSVYKNNKITSRKLTVLSME